MPNVPPVAATAAANETGYPARIMAGTMIPPIAAVVAGPEPVKEAKNMHDTMVTTAKPPDTLPTEMLIMRMMRSVRPECSINRPARMKPGIAISGNNPTPV